METAPPNPLALLRQLEHASRGGNAPALASATPAVWHGLTFQLGDLHFVAPIMRGLEIAPTGVVQPLPLRRGWVKGMMYINGEIYTLIDFARLLGISHAPSGNRANLLLHSNHRDKQALRKALLLDSPIGVRSFARRAPADTMPVAVAGFPALLQPFLRAQWLEGEAVWGVIELAALMNSEKLRNLG